MRVNTESNTCILALAAGTKEPICMHKAEYGTQELLDYKALSLSEEEPSMIARRNDCVNIRDTRNAALYGVSILSSGAGHYLRHDGYEGALPDVAAFAAHVGPRHNAGPGPALTAQRGVIGHHLRADEGGIQHWVPPQLDHQLWLLILADKVWPDIPAS